MDKEQNKDNLETFFRRELENYQEDPGAGMWDKIAMAIPPKPGLGLAATLLKWKFSLLLALSTGLLVFAIYEHQRANELDRHNRQREEKILALQEKTTKLEQKMAHLQMAQSATHSPPPTTEKPEVKTTATSTPTEQVITPSNSDLRYNASAVANNPIRESVQTEAPLQNDLPLAKDEQMEVNLTSDQWSNLGPLNRDFRIESTLPAIAIASPIIKNQNYYPRFSVGAWTGNIVVQYYAVDRRVSPAAGTSTSVFLSKTAGLSAGIQLDKHWSLHTGLSFRNNGFSLSDKVSLEYDADIATENANGDLVGDYTFSQEGILTFRAQIVNQQGSSEPEIADGESFDVDFNSAYRLRYYSIPLWVKYQIGQQKFHTYLKGGFIWNKLMRDWANFPSIRLSSGRLIATNPRLTVSAARDSYFEFGLAMGIGYNITPRIELVLEPSYYQAITPMLNVKPQTYGIQGHINYMF